MHDIKFIRENPEAFDAALKRRPAYDGVKSNELLELDKANRGGKYIVGYPRTYGVSGTLAYNGVPVMLHKNGIFIICGNPGWSK